MLPSLVDTNRAPLTLDVSLLEPILQDWVRLLGIEPTLVLVQTYGGTRLCVPLGLDSDHHLAELIGLDLAQQLCRAYGGERPAVPKAVRAIRAARNAWIATNPDQLSVPELARATGLAERAVFCIRAAAATRSHPAQAITPWATAEPSPQGGLFD